MQTSVVPAPISIAQYKPCAAESSCVTKDETAATISGITEYSISGSELSIFL